MGRFLNPDNRAFQIALNSKIYVDKTGLLDITNQSIDTDAAFVCNSRPRRFGKSITANMLAAYYSRGCDSRDMFADLKIGGMASFEQHINQYDVIHVDVQWCMMDAGGPENTVSYLNEHLIDVLTLLIHMGYLAYNQDKKTAYIPNEEIRGEFADKDKTHRCFIELYQKE